MNTNRKTILIISTLTLLIATRAYCAEILANGNLESFASGNPTSWTYQQGEGPATLESSASVSPFTNVYPASTRSALFTDGSAANFTPTLSQAFPTQSGSLSFSFEFRLSSFGGDPWIWLPATDSSRFLTNVRLGGSGGEFSLGDNNVSPFALPLSAGAWYQVSMTFNLPANTYSGSITPFGGSATTWTNRSLMNNQNLASIRFEDAVFAAEANGAITIDNVSIQTVPEPSTFALLALSGSAILFKRRSTQRANGRMPLSAKLRFVGVAESAVAIPM